MSVTEVRDTILQASKWLKGLKLQGFTIDATAEMAIGAEWPTVLLIDPAGGAKTVLLPAEADSENLFFLIFNTADAAEALTVEEDSSTTQIADLLQNEAALFFCDGTTWRALVGANT